MKKRVLMLSTIQEGQIQEDSIKRIESEVNALYKRHFGEDRKVTTFWVIVPRGQAFLAALPSRASAVMIPVINGLATHRRHAFMKEFCSLWMDITGCDKSQIILNAPDGDYARDYLRVVANRFRPLMRGITRLRLLARMLGSRFTRGYFAASVNF